MSYELKFRTLAEIRMGSPYNFAEIELEGSSFIPPLPKKGFQDKGIVSDDKSRCYLVHWETAADGGPAFSIWKLDEKEKTLMKSVIIDGCCEAIEELRAGSVVLTVWQYEKGIRKETVENFESEVHHLKGI